MTATLEQAKAEIVSLIRDTWESDGTTSAIPLLYEGVAGDPPKDGDPFARIAVRHATGEQTSIGGASGQQRFRRDGTVHIQCFGQFGDGGREAYQMAEVALKSLEAQGTSRGVWFRNPGAQDIGQDGSHYYVQVTAGFVYQQVRSLPTGPTAAFTTSASNLDLTVTDASTAGDAAIIDHLYKFGDGSGASLDASPSYSYATGGTYTISLTVTDANGRSDTATEDVTVAGNVAPTASFTTAISGLDVDLTDTSSDSDGTIDSISIDWGDGNTESGTVGGVTSHTYASADTYTIELTATDDNGATDTASDDVTVEEAVPTDGPDSVYVPETTSHFDTLNIPPPTDIYVCDEASGDLVSATGTDSLAASGTGHLYEQSVSGWSSPFVGVDTAGEGEWTKAFSLSSGESCFVLIYASFTAASVTELFGAAGDDDRLTTSSDGLVRTRHGGSPDPGSLDHSGINSVHALGWSRNADDNASGAYTNLEFISGDHDESAISDTFGLRNTGNLQIRVARIYRWVGSDADALISAGLANETLLSLLGWSISY